jgi:DNA processing protein
VKKVLGMEKPEQRVEAELEEASRMGIQVLVEGDPDFPNVFQDLYDPPFVLWMRGQWIPEDLNAIAVIGCRQPSSYGKQAALRLAEGIAKAGYTVISGLARGIDSLAHRGALKYPQGRTLAFLGSGLLNLYPPENKGLVEEIVSRGAVVSEYPLHSKPLGLHFPQRNRLISGAARGVLVVEAKKDSGSFITVDHALEQGRPVFAVPGPIDHPQSEGTHTLIQQGARLVAGVEDIFHELGDLRAETLYKTKEVSGTTSQDLYLLTQDEKNILERLSHEPKHMDQLAREALMDLPKLNEILLLLEMKGFIQQTPGHCYFRL